MSLPQNLPKRPARGRPRTAQPVSAAERMRQYRARQRAAGLRPIVRMQPTTTILTEGSLQHRIIEARSLAMHCLAARKIAREPSLLDGVRLNLKNWRERYAADMPRALDEWNTIINRPWAEIATLITDPGENAARLRQSTPFAGVLTPEERERIYAAFRP